MRKLLLGIILGILVIPALHSQTSLEGKVQDENKEGLIGATVVLFKSGVQKNGTTTDIDGNYSISNIDPGTYDVEFSYIGYQTQRIQGVIVFAGKSNRLNAELNTGIVLNEVVVTEYKVPLIQQDNTTSGGTVTSEQIRNLPTKNINELAATTAGIASQNGGALNIRGSRSNATNYYIDGVRVNTSLIPQTEIDQLQVITGGVEARYGDVTGGVISITTKGPSNKFTGGIELETSQYLDPYGYNLLNTNFSGPILKNKKGISVLGYRLSAQYRRQEDDSPSATGTYYANQDKLKELEANPVTRLQGVPLSSAEFLTNNDVNLKSARINELANRIDLNGKIDARLSQKIDISFTGAFNDNQNRFSPSAGWNLLNYENNPIATGQNYRVGFKWRHRLQGDPLEATRKTKKGDNRFLRNAIYTLQASYEKGRSNSEDYVHKDRLFDYGYVGNFDISWIPVEGESTYSRGPIPGVAHAGYLQQLNGYTPGTINPVLANYNNGLDGNTLLDYYAYNGSLSSNYNSAWRLHSNVGSVYNSYAKGESDIMTFNGEGSFDLFPGGSDKGRHNIQVGFIYEKRENRSWGINPNGLWTIARLQANNHIKGVDTTQIIGSFPGVVTPFTYEQFKTLIEEDKDLLFYKRIRELTGQSLNDYVNVDGLQPADLRLDMFSASELTDQGILDYYGYDYLGNKLSTKAKFEDFFTSVDAEGRRTFVVAPNRPTYAAAYIQDKFNYKDLILRLGVRIDRYDANTKVLKDPFSLYEITQAKDFFATTGDPKPDAVGDDYLVYVTGKNSNNVKAYRKGEQWYFPNGTPANDGSVLFGGEIVTPKLKDPNSNIRLKSFDPSQSFTDYVPQINVMPRLAFSFPISDDANFYAHYDILVQRPPSNTIATALDYYYFEDPSRTPSNNPNLKPERTIDYEVGFQQKLTNSSALKMSAYYKEMRDMIQSRNYLYVPSPVNSYTGFGNLDFGTVKGFSFQYDLRRTNNIELQANYTLQFADGTGSSSTSQRGLNTRGNIRSLFPLNFDERHRLVTVLDYRYASGRAYSGPRINGLDILANAGINIQANAVSGRPYTKLQRAQPLGGTGFAGALNGSRLPWSFSLDLRADKSFLVGGANSKFPMQLNIYFRVQNVLNQKSVFGVYPVSGSPEDDGYLTSTDGKSALNTVLNSGRDVNAYLASYQWAELNPGFYSLPRRIFLGAIVEF
ncbi:MAG: carboxypeptidase regulatory-like domain-containing protein [Saprospiraceae bacterium]|nr:carboxypeptidase regulatory-like domain-containing protein [Saprospiraceae bacterium]MBK7436389.1 carboxypeptidase regulatory-like domain-containing protein [Saprospiraceae bacterium]MBK9679939.1 carboxypeptidase regulatory-like domain-containing protein [Saprospiraceae bacterium]MBK9929074.1 carboxypeptidase regulatory-like domain-containing protein [Saprospiraceae bacterium]MBP7920996.1 carboxypeptidase regulatory-like domain-containing protein [Saprospiraceae bacterium]